MARLAEKVKTLFPQAEFDAPVAPHTTFGVGGQALALLKIKSPTELVASVRLARKNKIPHTIIAGGSNIVWPDKFYSGLVLVFRNPRGKILIKGQTVEIEACLPLAELIKAAIKNGLSGLEALSGVPGTVGGAVVGNAGAYGQTISDCLTEVEIFDPNVKHPMFNRVRWLAKKDCQFGYRDSIFKRKNYLVLRVRFSLKKGDKKELTKKSRAVIKARQGKFSAAWKCPGSFFKNVLANKLSRTVLDKIDQSKIINGKIPAGYLLSAAGARGARQGGVAVSAVHGNFLLNVGGGTAADVRKLAARLRQKVKRKFSIKLEEEVRFL